jgi:hypothetical protein
MNIMYSFHLCSHQFDVGSVDWHVSIAHEILSIAVGMYSANQKFYSSYQLANRNIFQGPGHREQQTYHKPVRRGGHGSPAGTHVHTEQLGRIHPRNASPGQRKTHDVDIHKCDGGVRGILIAECEIGLPRERVIDRVT